MAGQAQMQKKRTQEVLGEIEGRIAQRLKEIQLSKFDFSELIAIGTKTASMQALIPIRKEDKFTGIAPEETRQARQLANELGKWLSECSRHNEFGYDKSWHRVKVD